MGKQLTFLALRDGKGVTQLQLPATDKLKAVLDAHELHGRFFC